MRSPSLVLALLALPLALPLVLPVACCSSELAAVAPTTLELHTLNSRAPGVDAAQPGEWAEVLLPTGPEVRADHDGEAWQHHVTLFIGRRNYSDGNLDQTFVGSDLDVGNSGFKGLEIEGCEVSSGHGYEVGAAFAYQTDGVDVNEFDYELTTEEFYGGYRYTFRTADPGNCCHPFIAAGLSVIRAHFDSPGFAPFNDDASALAGYGRLGVTWDVGARLRLGLDYRQLFGTNDLEFGTPLGTSSADVDHEQVAFTIGYLL